MVGKVLTSPKNIAREEAARGSVSWELGSCWWPVLWYAGFLMHCDIHVFSSDHEKAFVFSHDNYSSFKITKSTTAT